VPRFRPGDLLALQPEVIVVSNRDASYLLHQNILSLMKSCGEYMVARNGWVGDYSDPSNMLDLFCTGNGNNDGKFSNADFDAAGNLYDLTGGLRFYSE